MQKKSEIVVGILMGGVGYGVSRGGVTMAMSKYRAKQNGNFLLNPIVVRADKCIIRAC